MSQLSVTSLVDGTVRKQTLRDVLSCHFEEMQQELSFRFSRALDLVPDQFNAFDIYIYLFLSIHIYVPP